MKKIGPYDLMETNDYNWREIPDTNILYKKINNYFFQVKKYRRACAAEHFRRGNYLKSFLKWINIFFPFFMRKTEKQKFLKKLNDIKNKLHSSYKQPDISRSVTLEFNHLLSDQKIFNLEKSEKNNTIKRSINSIILCNKTKDFDFYNFSEKEEIIKSLTDAMKHFLLKKINTHEYRLIKKGNDKNQLLAGGLEKIRTALYETINFLPVEEKRVPQKLYATIATARMRLYHLTLDKTTGHTLSSLDEIISPISSIIKNFIYSREYVMKDAFSKKMTEKLWKTLAALHNDDKNHTTKLATFTKTPA